MADFLEVASNLHRQKAVEDKKAAADFEKVFSAIGALQAAHSKAQLDLTNIESIFAALEIANVLGKLPGTQPQDIPGVIAALRELIVKTLELTIKFPTKGRHRIEPPKPYGDFTELLRYLRADASPSHTVSVITFNYDIAVDIALYRAGMGPDYGIVPKTQHRNPVPLLKLHGSLNWAARDDGTVYPLLLDDYFEKSGLPWSFEGNECTVPIGSQLQEYFSQLNPKIKVVREPVIVPPTWNKANHYQGLSDVWANAAHQLEEAEYLFIIGYSLPPTDAFFRMLYALGTVGKNPLTKIVVYNPDTRDVDGRFQSMLGLGAKARYEYVQTIFQGAIGDIKRYFPARK
jgi:hypothetical protein